LLTKNSHTKQQQEALHEEMLAVDDQIEMLDRGDLEHRLKLLSASYKEEKGKAQVCV